MHRSSIFGYSFYMQIGKRFAYGLIIILIALGCSNVSTYKAYSIYFLQSLSSMARPTAKYITRYADRIVHTDSDTAKELFQLFEDAEHRVKGSRHFESSLLIIRNSDGLKLRLGIDETCDWLTLDNEGYGVCSKEHSELAFSILFPK